MWLGILFLAILNSVYSFQNLHKNNVHFKVNKFSVVPTRLNIPVDISSTDKLSFDPNLSTLVPNTDISSLSGGDNLGTILWAVLLFNGIFPIAGKPCDWVLPWIAKPLNMTESDWIKDYETGYAFSCPPTVDAIRFVFFLFLGYYVNQMVISSLGGDEFWGWSIAMSLLIPSSLITAAREEKPTREKAEFEVCSLIRIFSSSRKC
jgi:hypothetical protein